MIALCIAIVLVLVVLLFVVAAVPLRRARDAWRRGQVAEAIATAEAWSRLRLWPAQYHQILAAAYLSAGNTSAAQPHVAALREAGAPMVSLLEKREVARRFFARERYAEYLTYDDALRDAAYAPVERAAALLATGRIAEAEKALQGLDASVSRSAEAEDLRQSVQQRKAGVYPLVFDRSGQPVAEVHASSRDLVAVDPAFAPLVERSAGSLTFESHLAIAAAGAIDTTLDRRIQKAAAAALGNYRGSLVAIDLRTGGILAAASTSGTGRMANLAFEQQYEPGSVIKVLTEMNAIDSGLSLDSLFPYECRGDLLIDGRHFGDWLAQGHGTLSSVDEALAESCNIVFADIGVRLGSEKLEALMKRAGFDGVAGVGLFAVPLGRTIPPIFNRYETAFYAIGLEHASLNAMHLAMIASIVAHRGVLRMPVLVRGRRTILGDTIPLARPSGEVRVASAKAAEAATRSMIAVVAHSEGTGRRAAIPGVRMALKTGTAGKREQGLQALVMGFVPADNPRIAFGLIAEHAGPAEFAGAQIAHDFVAAVLAEMP